MVDHLLECAHRPIVHVRRRQGHITQGGHLELAMVPGLQRDALPSGIGVGGVLSDVLERMIAEVEATVAGDAVDLRAGEQGPALLFLSAHGGQVSLLETIEARPATDQGPFVSRDRATEHPGIHPPAVGQFAQFGIGFLIGQERSGHLDVMVHLYWVMDRCDDLLFQGGDPAIAEEGRMPREVGQGR